MDDYPSRLLAALRAAAPRGTSDPCVVVLTPGVHNAAYFEHTLLARLMGVELVEGRDLFCARNRVYVHTTRGRRPVDVIYRRVDDDFLDPLQFRPDSVIGCPGLINAARAGHVTIANAVGNGVADDKLVYTYIPDLIRYYLSEEPILDNVESYRLDDPEMLAWVLDSLDELVVKPVDGAGGAGIVIGPQASAAELAVLRERLQADPRGWMAQRPVALSTSPVLIGEALAPRHIDLRPVRRQRRRRRVAAARRPDPGRAAGRGAGRQLQPGRRIEGHLGAGRAEVSHPGAARRAVFHAGGPVGRGPATVSRQSGPDQ